MWYPITSQQATPIAPPKTTPTCFTSVYRCHACLEIGRVLPICRKSGHVSATLTIELQHMLLWTVSRRIGSTVIQSRKQKSFAYVCIFGDYFHRFWETLVQLLILRPRNLLRAMILTWIQEEKWEQLLLQISNFVGTLCGYERIKNVGVDFGWGSGLVGCDWISHHIPIAFTFPELLHATCVSKRLRWHSGSSHHW